MTTLTRTRWQCQYHHTHTQTHTQTYRSHIELKPFIGHFCLYAHEMLRTSCVRNNCHLICTGKEGGWWEKGGSSRSNYRGTHNEKINMLATLKLNRERQWTNCCCSAVYDRRRNKVELDSWPEQLVKLKFAHDLLTLYVLPLPPSPLLFFPPTHALCLSVVILPRGIL